MIYSGGLAHVHFCCDELDMEDEFDIEVPVQENFKDILAYYFEKKYEVPYSETSWVIEKDARGFVRDLEDKWLHNEIDTFTLYHDSEFLEFLNNRGIDDSDNYVDDVVEDAYQDFLRECEDECRFHMSAKDLKTLVDDNYGTIYVEMYIDNMYYSPIHNEIDIEEIYDEEYGDWEDEEEEED